MSAPSTASDRPRHLLPMLAWSTGAMFFFYAWVLRVAPSVMVEELMREFAVGAGVLGHLSAAYFYGYAGMQIPVGLLLDRFGPRRLMTVAALACAGGCILFAVSDTLTAATVGRFLIGACAAFSLVGAMAIAGQWFPAHFAILSGLAMAAGMTGGMVGQAPLAACHGSHRLAHHNAAACRRRHRPGAGCVGHGARQAARQRRPGVACSPAWRQFYATGKRG